MTKLMPNELQLTPLLAPFIPTGGEPHVRDLALRIRVFTEAFNAWESLHLHLSPASLAFKTDITRTLRAADLTPRQLREAIRNYDAFRAYINGFARRLFPYLVDWSSDLMTLHASFYQGGRGIVFTAGDAQVPFLMTSIPSLRSLGCGLPIEVMFLGDADLSSQSRSILEALDGVITRDMSHMIDDTDWALRGWAAKPFAILLSSFREAIFIDADALSFVNLEILFTDEQYLGTGALFFKDRNTMPGSKRSWLTEILPQPVSHLVEENRMWTGESTHMQDSGVVVVDKWKHFLPLLLTTRLNGPDRDGDEEKGKKGVYQMVFGDKETFWLSWELTGNHDYAFYDGEAGTMGILSKTPELPQQSSVSTNEQEPLAKGLSTLSKDPASTLAIESSVASRRQKLLNRRNTPCICSQQLVHFDRAGQPLWFNGWLATQKLDDETEVEFRDFEYYAREMKGRRRRGERDPYSVHPRNVVCMQTTQTFAFTDEEQATLKMMRDFAKVAIAKRDGLE
ncbi:hypothetical protein LTR78_003392 [Recurvomyces mirabilis]|uniref:Alpha-1,3-mannosyltransferase n=1 Tax=Recurvomyces mirabilis TaxID=574656 RepID=A0AAE0WRR3_9PEZI|nr:hypothetical protein LTR78_003392 [Recurvomyces mirabilis]KAK5154572.1 hypothetical protein LTS14_006710 [Recurvomyces mirabilis]